MIRSTFGCSSRPAELTQPLRLKDEMIQRRLYVCDLCERNCLCPNRKLLNERPRTKPKENRPARRQASLFTKRSNTFAKGSTALVQRSRRLRLGFPKRVAL